MKAGLIIACINTIYKQSRNLSLKENEGQNGILTHDLWDTSAVALYHLTYQANWELVSLWVRNKPVDGEEYKWIYERSYIWTEENDMIEHDWWCRGLFRFAMYYIALSLHIHHAFNRFANHKQLLVLIVLLLLSESFQALIPLVLLTFSIPCIDWTAILPGMLLPWTLLPFKRKWRTKTQPLNMNLMSSAMMSCFLY